MLSLFDHSGYFVRPWLARGFHAWLVDIKFPPGINLEEPGIFKVGADLRFGFNLDIDNVVFVAAFPPCTHTAVSGARHFMKKGPRAMAESLDLFATAQEAAEHFKARYFIENPVSMFSSYIRKPDYIFHPYEYGGYLPENDEHPDCQYLN